MLPAWALTWSHLPLFLPCTVTHMCHDMTGLAIMAGRLGDKTFCLPHARNACHGLDCLGTRVLGRCSGSSQVRSVPSSLEGGRFSCNPKKECMLYKPHTSSCHATGATTGACAACPGRKGCPTPKCAVIVPAKRGCHMPLAHQRCRLQLPFSQAAEVLAAAASVVDAVPDVTAAGLTSARGCWQKGRHF